MSRLVLQNGSIYTPGGVIENGYLIVRENGEIEAIGAGQAPSAGDAEVRDCTGLLVLPGFIDVHVHGGGGVGMLEATFEGLEGMSRYHAQFGTTAFLATSSTTDMDRIKRALRNAAESIGKTTGAELAGIHLEGPYLNEIRRGAQSKDHIRLPQIDEIQELLNEAGGHIRLVTLAPEVEGGLKASAWLAEQGVTVSAGHSNATFAEMEAAVQHGVNHTTHHFNGMSPFHHRDPGLAGAGMILPELTTELICDGIHVHPGAVKLLFEVKKPEGVCMITDAIFAAGLPNGDYKNIVVKDGVIMLSDGSSLAGSSLTMLQALKNVIRFTGLSLETVLPSLTAVPARQVRLDQTKGSLEPGKHADFLLLTPELELQATFVRGKEVYSA
ncbi:N-acetylglucosamine-6-phosphate deacetylase [Paenibacillus koleovorans]|uniref:N-acetylglucosamine-6-phosphate deacetylase n=1 Tax=Paenibacillus koleovorans TaxID=121608 RepID=UPI0013E328DA|nr:N-acetylglucosamine-6-phosphate deacetylase [Paenibacillus koleovorans]